jgi:cell division protein FtsW (lipid II flippase)
MLDDFQDTGSALLRKPFYLACLGFLAVACALAIASRGLMVGLMIMVMPVLVYTVIRIFNDPRFGLYLAFAFSFLATGISRYITANIPFGLGVDAILVLVLVAMILGNGRKLNWRAAGNDLTALSALWMAFTIIQIANPEAVSMAAWFYAMRGVALYQILVVIIGFLILKDEKDLKLFLVLWFGISVLAALKGIQQIKIGPDPWENAWLDGGGAITHRIQGRLRAFSIYSDAGQFGAAMGHAALVSAIIALGPVTRRLKIVLFVIALLTILGMLFSGTRGAMFVPAAGGLLYLVLSKNFRVFIVGMVFVAGVYGVLRYTTVGNTNYQIYRLRTAVQPSNDRSFQVRLENQQKLKGYLASRPLGGGIGSAGNWGMRFSPNTFLAQTPTDSWFVRIWAEMGIIGLIIHLIILFYLLIRCCLIVWRLQDPGIRQVMIGLTCGIFGIMLASYGNGLYGQMPTCLIIYMSYVFIYISPSMEKSLPLRPSLSK